MNSPKAVRACGACSLCCKVLEIEALAKLEGLWCSHCRPSNGCAIYEMRPSVCRGFECMWLDNSVSDDWQPLNSKMVVGWMADKGNGDLYLGITVDSGSSKRWREEPFYSDIRRMAALGLRHPEGTWWTTRVHVRGSVWVILPEEEVEITAETFRIKQIGFKNWEVVEGES